MSVEQGMELLASKVLPQIGVPSDEVIPISMQEMRWIRVLVTIWCESTDLDPRRILGVEERLTADLPLPTGKTVQVTGQMDVIAADPPDGLTIIDWKTGFKRPKAPHDPEKAASEGSGLTDLGWVQWLVYSFLGFNEFPSVSRIVFRERHVLWNEERYARMERWEMERLVDVLAAQVSLIDRAVEEGPQSPIWTPSAGPHCATCANPRACPIMELEQIDLETEEGRRLVAQEWIVAGEVRKARRKVLDGLVDAHGPIEVPHADGRRVVGWELGPDGRRNFGLYEPYEVPDSPYDEILADAAEQAGILRHDRQP